MISVTNLDLSKQLAERWPEWEETTFFWYCDEERDDEPAYNLSPLKVVGGVGYFDHRYPAFTLDELRLKALELIGPKPAYLLGNKAKLWQDKTNSLKEVLLLGCDATGEWLLKEFGAETS